MSVLHGRSPVVSIRKKWVSVILQKFHWMGKNYRVIKMDRYNEYQTKLYTYTRTNTHTARTLVGDQTWLSDHQGRPSAPLSRCVKVSKYGALTNLLQLQDGCPEFLKLPLCLTSMQKCLPALKHMHHK